MLYSQGRSIHCGWTTVDLVVGDVVMLLLRFLIPILVAAFTVIACGEKKEKKQEAPFVAQPKYETPDREDITSADDEERRSDYEDAPYREQNYRNVFTNSGMPYDAAEYVTNVMQRNGVTGHFESTGFQTGASFVASAGFDRLSYVSYGASQTVKSHDTHAASLVSVGLQVLVNQKKAWYIPINPPPGFQSRTLTYMGALTNLHIGLGYEIAYMGGVGGTTGQLLVVTSGAGLGVGVAAGTITISPR